MVYFTFWNWRKNMGLFFQWELFQQQVQRVIIDIGSGVSFSLATLTLL